MKKIIISVLFIIICNLLSGETFTWTNVDKITISLPGDWEKDNNIDLFLNQILKFRHKKYKNFTITLTYKKLINLDSSRHYAHFDANVLKKKKFVILSNSSRKINRIPAYEYVYRNYQVLYNSFDKDYFTIRKIYIVIGRKYYSFIFSCPSVYYEEYQRILQKIIDNFIIEIKTDINGNT